MTAITAGGPNVVDLACTIADFYVQNENLWWDKVLRCAQPVLASLQKLDIKSLITNYNEHIAPRLLEMTPNLRALSIEIAALQSYLSSPQRVFSAVLNNILKEQNPVFPQLESLKVSNTFVLQGLMIGVYAEYLVRFLVLQAQTLRKVHL
jgi:hypothetical protein